MIGENKLGPEPSLAILRNYKALMHLLTYLFTYIGLSDDTRHATRMLGASGADGRCIGLVCALRAAARPDTLVRRIIRRIQALIVPVESATRRLIVMIAAGLPKPVLQPLTPAALAKLQEAVARQRPSWQPVADANNAEQLSLAADAARANASGTGAAVPDPAAPPEIGQPMFALCDRPRTRDRRYDDASVPLPPFDRSVFEPDPERGWDPICTASYMRRVAALAHALGDLEAQAKRYLIWKLRRERARAAGRFVTATPLKPGWPWGTPARNVPKSKHREEHHVLAETNTLAWYALRYPNDTS